MKPGDSFGSPAEAAIDALNYINSRSICQNKEYGGAIYKTWSFGFGAPSYTYDEPTPGDFENVPIPLPSLHSFYALFHTHGAEMPGYNSENLSIPDMWAAVRLNIPSYLGTPSGLIKRFDPDPVHGRGHTTTVGKTSSCACGQ